MISMLKMILADDEVIVRNGLKKALHWEEFGIEIVAEAGDGLEALELCRRHNPDILFIDIRMPIMDGLEVALKLRKMESNIRIIIISGIQDFNYAKTALDLNAEGYVLKPVKIPELAETIKKVSNKIKFERNRQAEMSNLKQQLHEHFPVIREKFLRSLVLGAYQDEAQIRDKLTYFKMNFDIRESVMVAVLQIDDYSIISETAPEEEKQLLSFSVLNIAEELLSNYNAGTVFCLNENEFIMLLNQSSFLNGKYMEACEEIVSSLDKFLHISVSIGIGRSVGNMLSVNSSYTDACSALQYKFYTGKGSILDINDINIMNDVNANSIVNFNIYDIENQLMNHIKSGNSEIISNIIGKLFRGLRSGSNVPVDYVQSICVEMVCIASRTVQDMGANPEDIIGKLSGVLDLIYKKENIDELQKYMADIFIDITLYISKKYNQKNSRVISRIREIIEERYYENISVAKISEEVFLTPNYISMMFKQEMNETISEYLTKVRMEQAKKLLKSTDLRILEIAEKVGYEDANYFSKVFKKYTGILPQKFRS